MVKPTKVYNTPSWSEVAGLRKDTAFPVTQQMANKAYDDISNAPGVAGKIVMGAVHAPAVAVSPILDTVGAVGNAALNGYKTVYNYGADAINRIKGNVVDKQIKDFQKENPNTTGTPKGKKYPSNADLVKAAGAVTDAEVWDATHRFGYGNDPETVFNRYKNRRKWKKQQNQYSGQISL